MPTVKDIGGGWTGLDFSEDAKASQVNGPEMVKNLLSLQQLQQQIENGALEGQLKQGQLSQQPLEQAQKQLDLVLKQNDVNQIAVKNATAFAEYVSKVGGERRSQASFMNEQLANVHNGFAQSFELGSAMLKNLDPKSLTVKNDNGTVSALVGGKPFTFAPNAVSDPKVKAELETNYRKEWIAKGKNFEVQDQYFKNMEGLSNLGTPQADIGIVFSYMKLLDPNSSVREGEYASAQNAPGVPERVMNMYNRALTAKAPLFGPVGSDTRTNFINAARVLRDNTSQDMILGGKSYLGIAQRSGLDARNILTPIGSVDYKSIAGEEAGATQPVNNPGAPQAPEFLRPNAQRQQPKEAGFSLGFVGQQEPGAPAKLIPYNQKKQDLFQR